MTWLLQSYPHRQRVTVPYPVQGLNFCLYFHVHVTVRFVGRNVALLLTVGVDAFAPVLSFNNCINTGQQALIGIPIVIC